MIELKGVSKRYGEVLAVRNAGLRVEPGELVALLGPSGAGKSTVFRCLTALTRPDAGEVWVQGRRMDVLTGSQLREARRSIGLIFQQHNLIGRLSALRNVLTGRLHGTPAWRVITGRFAYEDRQFALASLDRVGLLEKSYVRADALSGGQQQRVAIARVLAQQGSVILADEPVASLDPQSAQQVLQVLRSIAQDHGIAVLCSLHQVELARQFADRIVGMKEGAVVLDLPPGELSEEALRALYASPRAQRAPGSGTQGQPGADRTVASLA